MTANKLQILDLFSGIGGFSLGLERAVSDGPYTGFETAAFCEIEPYPRKILAQHWSKVPIYDDVRTLTAERLAVDGIGPIDLICGGYPCQPFSTAGLRMGDQDDRHLWPEVHRLLDELRPSWFIGENVAGHISLGLDEVLFDLEALGYAARAFAIPACAADAPHRRNRVWILANANRERGRASGPSKAQSRAAIAVAATSQQLGVLADATGQRQQGQGQPIERGSQATDGKGQANQPLSIGEPSFWPIEPELGRVANGIPNRVDRLKSLGNAVVPRIPEMIGNAILEACQ